MIVNCLEAMVEVKITDEEGKEGFKNELGSMGKSEDEAMNSYPSLLSVSANNLSASMSSLTLSSPTDKGTFLIVQNTNTT